MISFVEALKKVWFGWGSLQNEFELKYEVLGNGVGDVPEAKFLGRTIRWKSHGIEIEGDNKHVKILLEEWDMMNSKPVSTPGTADEKADNVQSHC